MAMQLPIVPLPSPSRRKFSLNSMELLTPTPPVVFGHGIPIRGYYASPSSSLSPNLTNATTVSTLCTNDSDSERDDDYSSLIYPSPDNVVPKIEEVDDIEDKHLHQVEDAKDPVGVVSLPSPPPASPARKKRGRPRKHPISESTADAKKASHARSKTGCWTCRRRKKKCDETKPHCLNCEKNNFVCDGYEPKKQWRSGKQKTQELLTLPIPLPRIAPPGVESDIDRQFLDYFLRKVVPTLAHTDRSSPFMDFILPMASADLGLMHSVLLLSASCQAAMSPGMSRAFEDRQLHHRKGARRHLCTTPYRPSSCGVVSAGIDLGTQTTVSHWLTADPAIAQMLMMCLETIAKGNIHGEWRLHLESLKTMLTQRGKTFTNQGFRRFLIEFLLYHDYSSVMTSLVHTVDWRSEELMNSLEAPELTTETSAGFLAGVTDGLFELIIRIRNLRDQIRGLRALHQSASWWEWSDNIRKPAFQIERDILTWECDFPPASPRFKTGMLYRQATWVYLYRTLSPSQPSAKLRQAVNDGLNIVRGISWGGKDGEDEAGMQSVLLMPLFLLGCAAFDKDQRDGIEDAFEQLSRWSSLGNIPKAQEIVELVWDLMDKGKEEESWDWETVISKHGFDTLMT